MTLARTALWLLAVLPLAAMSGSTPGEPRITFFADLEIQGPLMEVWKIGWDGKSNVKVSAYWGARGELQGEFYASPVYLQRVADVVREQRFHELPETIIAQTVGLDAADLRIEVTLDGRKHEVKLYDPSQLAGDPRWTRFRAVMIEIATILPMQPKWPSHGAG